MRFSRTARTVGVAFIAANIFCGCAQSVALIRPKRAVELSLIQLAKATPEWASVAQFDQAVEMSDVSVKAIDLQNAAEARPSVIAAPVVESGSAGKARLEASVLQNQADRAIATVRARLERDSTRLMAVATVQATRKVADGVELARRDAIAHYEAKLPTLIDRDADKRLELQVQVTGLKVNADPKNAPTAPDDYWGKLLEQRREELAALNAPQLEAERSARQQIETAVASAKTKLDLQAQADLAAYEDSLDARQKSVIARQMEAISTEHAELNTVSDQLDEELREPVGIVGSTIGEIGGVAGSVGGESLGDSYGANAISPNVTAESLASRNAQRRRLVAVILQQTKLRAAQAADSLGLKVVSWNSSAPDAYAMSVISARLRSQMAI